MRETGLTRGFLSASPSLTIFGIGFVLRMIWVLTLGRETTWPDELDYSVIARHLAAGEGYISTSYRAVPVLPFYLSVVFRVFGESYLVARIGQAIFGALTCVLLYRIGSRLFGSAAGQISGLLLAIYPPHIYLAGVFYAEGLATFVFALSVYLAICSAGHDAPRPLSLLTGVALALTALTRSVFAVCMPCVCIAWLCHSGTPWRKRVWACALCFLGFFGTILPWTLRNYFVYRRLIPISSGFYQQLWWGNNELATGSAEDRFLYIGQQLWMERLQRLDRAQQLAVMDRYSTVTNQIAQRTLQYGDPAIAADEVLHPLVISYIASHLWQTFARTVKKLGAMFFTAFGETLTKNKYTTPRYKLVAAVSYYPILVLALAGTWLGLSRWRGLCLVYLLIGSVALAQSIMTVNTRYRLPLDPYLILLAALALDWCNARRRQHVPTSRRI